MGRVEKRQYRQRRGQAAVSQLLLVLAVLLAAFGLLRRIRGAENISVEPIHAPTATPLTDVCDETMQSIEVTLGEDVWYVIQTGVFTQREAALVRADAYKDRGAPGVVVEEGGRYRVFIAGFSDKADAASVREKLNSQQAVETYLYTWCCPELKLRLSGMTGQVDLAKAGLTMAQEAAAQLRDYAVALDQGGVTKGDVLTLTAGLEATFSAWDQALSQRFSKPYPALIEAECALVVRWREARQAIERAAGEGVTALSSALKCQSMQLFARVIAMRATLESN